MNYLLVVQVFVRIPARCTQAAKLTNKTNDISQEQVSFGSRFLDTKH